MILARINLELSSVCLKTPGCSMCGRRKLEKEHPDKCDWGFMDWPLVDKIARQVPAGLLVQFHLNGDPLHYPQLSRALTAFKHCIRAFNTHGIGLADKAEHIMGNLESLTVSVVQDDTADNYEQQRKNIREFMKLKGDKSPHLVGLRFLGNVDQRPWNFLGLKHITRPLHSPDGSFDYAKQVTLPETLICQDLLNSIAIERSGTVKMCARFDPDGLGVIGDLNLASLEEIVNSVESQPWQKGKHLRKKYTDMHVAGMRNEVPLCAACHFYGVPRGNS